MPNICCYAADIGSWTFADKSLWTKESGEQEFQNMWMQTTAMYNSLLDETDPIKQRQMRWERRNLVRFMAQEKQKFETPQYRAKLD